AANPGLVVLGTTNLTGNTTITGDAVVTGNLTAGNLTALQTTFTSAVDEPLASLNATNTGNGRAFNATANGTGRAIVAVANSGSAMSASNNSAANATITVANGAAAGTAISAQGNVSVTGNTSVTGNASVAGNVTFASNAGSSATIGNAAGTNTVSGNTTFNQNVFANGNTTLGDVAGDAITVTGTATFTPQATFTGGAITANGSFIAGAAGAARAEISGGATPVAIVTNGTNNVTLNADGTFSTFAAPGTMSTMMTSAGLGAFGLFVDNSSTGGTGGAIVAQASGTGASGAPGTAAIDAQQLGSADAIGAHNTGGGRAITAVASQVATESAVMIDANGGVGRGATIISNTASAATPNAEATLVVTNNNATGYAIRTNGNIQINSFLEARSAGNTLMQMGLGVNHPQSGAGFTDGLVVGSTTNADNVFRVDGATGNLALGTGASPLLTTNNASKQITLDNTGNVANNGAHTLQITHGTQASGVRALFVTQPGGAGVSDGPMVEFRRENPNGALGSVLSLNQQNAASVGGVLDIANNGTGYGAAIVTT
ncbi:MAG: hypothetical protein LC116_02830, partial [Bacteroidetes bacterium]|nr:hypothetical protein [Bacteroidota bacterium]